MGRILILYGTTHGHTRRIAEAMGAIVRSEGIQADVADARDSRFISAASYAGVVVAASLHAGGYQRAVANWVRRNAGHLRSRPGAFIAVCLGILEDRPEVHQRLAMLMDRFLERTQWQPAIRRHVAGSLPYTRYGWLLKRIMRRMAAKAGGDTDISRDFEYTDWNQVSAIAREFVASVSAEPGFARRT